MTGSSSPRSAPDGAGHSRERLERVRRAWLGRKWYLGWRIRLRLAHLEFQAWLADRA